MANKITVPGLVTPNVVPAVSSMVEGMYSYLPHLAQGVNQVASMVHAANAQLTQLHMAALENQYFMKHLVKALKLDLPTMEQIRAEITADRIAYLKGLLTIADLTDDQKAGIQKQLDELEPPAPPPAAPKADA